MPTPEKIPPATVGQAPAAVAAPAQTGTAVASASVPEARAIIDPDSLLLDLWTSYPATDRAKIIRTMQGKAAPLSDMIGKVIEVEHLLAHRVEMVDGETGEVLIADRIVLVNPKGEAFQCVSAGIRRSVQVLAHYWGLPPWKPALKVTVEQQSTRRGFRTFTLQPVE